MVKNPGAPVWCAKCRDQGKGCSFRNVDWGVKAWPGVSKTEAGDLRRLEAAAKRKRTIDATSGLAPAVTRARSEGSSVESRTIVAGVPRDTVTVRPIPVTSLTFPGRYETIYLDDIQSLSEILNKRDRTPIGLEARLDEVYAVVDRERHHMERLNQLLATRGEMLLDLAELIQDEHLALTGRLAREQSESRGHDEDEYFNRSESEDEDDGVHGV